MTLQQHEQARALPILDLSDFDSADAAAREDFLAALRRAARDVGFFYLRGHGLDLALGQSIQSVARRFFALPEADKLALEMANSAHFRGYTRAGDELTRGRRDWREQFDIGAERPVIAQQAGSPAWTRLQGPNQWPDALPDLKPALLRWQRELTGVAIRVLQAFAVALAQPADAFEAIYGATPNEHIKLIRYPAGGSMRRRCRTPSSSTSASCWSWRPTAICARPCTGW